MSIDSLQDFVDVIRKQRLLEPEQLEEVTRRLQGRFSDSRALAKHLMQIGWLTVYQVNHLFQGRGHVLVLGPYRILDCLGEGGVSEVFKARDTRSGALVALKVIRDELLSNSEAVGRFEREMHAVTQLSHPNIIKAFDPDVVSGRHFFAMEYFEGTVLDKFVQLSGAMGSPSGVAKVCDLVWQAAQGLQHAHERGLVHRDIKPANLLLTKDGVVKVLDMGLARLSYPEGQTPVGPQLTREGITIGTPDYLSPEQARDARKADIRADIYSLGCTMYFLLSGRAPFQGGSLMEKLFKHQMSEPEPIESICPTVPETVGAIIRKMMAKKPENRYQTPADVANALEPLRA